MAASNCKAESMFYSVFRLRWKQVPFISICSWEIARDWCTIKGGEFQCSGNHFSLSLSPSFCLFFISFGSKKSERLTEFSAARLPPFHFLSQHTLLRMVQADLGYFGRRGRSADACRCCWKKRQLGVYYLTEGKKEPGVEWRAGLGESVRKEEEKSGGGDMKGE